MKTFDVEEVLQKMTLDQKASLCSGADFWHTEAFDGLEVPAVMVSDGPHGLRKQEEDADHMGIGGSIRAICFPTASAMACSWDRELINQVGDALGEECISEDIAVLLGPGINMKRSPLCGRNFEYYSEDPCLAGELGAAFVNGVQSRHVGTSLKHFAANNQERRRMSISAVADERVLREIYLAAFEKVVKQAKPWTVMCSYNRINGVYSCENKWLLDDVLRKEWGFDGLVMTDWGAMNRRIPSLEAGLDLEMPSSHGETDRQIVTAVQNGTLQESVLDTSVRRILNMVQKYLSHKSEDKKIYNKEAHHELAGKTAAESAVLLQNDGILPLRSGQKLAVIGSFAETPRIQGGGSSHINCWKTDSALNALKKINDLPGEHICEGDTCRTIPPLNCEITYAKGYDTESDTIDETLLSEAVETAKNADTAVLFVGLPDSFESEGYDRQHLDMPHCQNTLIERICDVQKNVVIVLHNGAPVTMPWKHRVNAILEMYLAGEASGSAAADLLTGRVNPSGKLAETFPLRLEDNPSYLNFPGNRKEVVYSEGIFIGYRYYDKKNLDVLFPFGYGLSYTEFRYDNLAIQVNGEQAHCARDTDNILISADITNTGKLPGKETVQLYVKNFIGTENRPEKELRDFTKIFLNPGETKKVTFKLNYRSFAYYNEAVGDWFVESGIYHICLGKSSRELPLIQPLEITATKRLPFYADDTTTCDDIELFSSHPEILDELFNSSAFTDIGGQSEGEGDAAERLRATFAETPLHSILSFSPEAVTWEQIQETIRRLNDAEPDTLH